MLVSEPSEPNCLFSILQQWIGSFRRKYRIVTAVASRPPAAPAWALLSALDL